MPTTVECRSCGLALFSLAFHAPKPLRYEECPRCGGTEFAEV